MAKHPDRLPIPLSSRLASASSALFSAQGREVDVAIGGIAFLLATNIELPQTFETVPMQKDQFDTEGEPGERTLSHWWRRSQDSWHEGAGNLYQESRGSEAPSGSFYESFGVDVWTRGELSLLRRMVEKSSSSTSRRRVRTYTDGATKGITAISDASLWTSTTVSGSFTALHSPAGKTMADGLVAGSKFYDVATDGTLYAGDVSAPGSATTWPCGTTPSRMLFGKGRLWMVGGPKIWQPDLSLAGGSAQNPVFTNPNAGWSYTCLAEGPAAMYFGGHDGQSSSIQAITLESDGGLPALSGATNTVVLPDGELVQEIAVLAGQFIGIGTNRGFRVGVIDGVGVTYGPLLVTPEGVTSCTAIATTDSFFLVGFATASGSALLYKVDTASPISDGVYPYAVDVECMSTGSVTSCVVYGTNPTQIVASTADGRTWYQHATELVSTGYLTTGRIRFRTNEKKLFKSIELECEPLRGQIIIDGLEESGTEFDIGTWAKQGVPGTGPFLINSALGAQRHIAIKLTLTRDVGDATRGPVVNSYLVRALPAVQPQRQYTLPLLCYDKERTRSGNWSGYDGYCNDRLDAMQALEDTADIVVFQDFNRNSGISVLIESMRFVATAPSKSRQDSTGNGGILVVQLRTVSV